MRSLFTGIGGIICMWLSSLCAMFAFLNGFAAVISLLTLLVCGFSGTLLQFLAFTTSAPFFAGFSYAALVAARHLLKDESQLKAPTNGISVLTLAKQKSRSLSPFHIRLAAICTAFFAGAIWTLAR